MLSKSFQDQELKNTRVKIHINDANDVPNEARAILRNGEVDLR
jgi:hypothetical protein